MKKNYLFIILLLIIPLFSVSGIFDDEELNPLPSLYFSPEDSQFLQGKGSGTPNEWLGQLGLALQKSQGNYWSSNVYSAQGFNVSKGVLTDQKGRILSQETYEVSPPIFSENHQFVASGNDFFYNFPSSKSEKSYYIYQLFDPKNPDIVKDSKDIISYSNKYLVKIDELKTSGGIKKLSIKDLSKLKHKTHFIISDNSLSPLTSINPSVQGAIYSNNPLGEIRKFCISSTTAGIPYNSYTGFQFGPTTVHGQNDRFYPFITGDDSISVVWKDSTSEKIYLSKISDKLKVTHTLLPLSLGILGGCTQNSKTGEFYYISISQNKDPYMALVKTDAQGHLIKKSYLSCKKKDFNVHAFNNNVLSLQYAEGTIAMNIARTMQKSSDGLNHQGAILALFNSEDLTLIKNFGQTAGHSFDSRLIFDGKDFISLNLGDNYPRGIIIHKISSLAQFIRGKVIYTFKTAHGRNPSPYRKDKNGNALAPGRWSNDNYTYTELGDVCRGKESYVVAFASEKSTKNEIATDNLNEPRNIGFVQVHQEFENQQQQGNVVTENVIISKGSNSADFGFFTFNGKFSPQKYHGVIWLTNYRDEKKENATHIKLVPISNNRYLLLWEKWSEKSFIETYAMIVSEQGKKLSEEIVLGKNIHINRKDRIISSGNSILWFTGQGDKLELNVFKLK